MKYQKEKLRKQSHLQSYMGFFIYKTNKIPVNQYKEIKDLYLENYKTLMKATEDDTNRWKDIPYSWTGRILLK